MHNVAACRCALTRALVLVRSIIQEYESGKAIPDGAIISKLNRALGVTLPKIPKPKKLTDEETKAT